MIERARPFYFCRFGLIALSNALSGVFRSKWRRSPRSFSSLARWFSLIGLGFFDGFFGTSIF